MLSSESNRWLMVLWPKLLSEQHQQGSHYYDLAIPISSEKDPAQYGKFMYFPFDSIDIPTALDIFTAVGFNA